MKTIKEMLENPVLLKQIDRYNRLLEHPREMLIPISHCVYPAMILNGHTYYQFNYKTNNGWVQSQPMNKLAAENCRKQKARELIKEIRQGRHH